jgi:hypothetical protein
MSDNKTIVDKKHYQNAILGIPFWVYIFRHLLIGYPLSIQSAEENNLACDKELICLKELL